MTQRDTPSPRAPAMVPAYTHAHTPPIPPQVYGIECAGIYKQAREIVKANKFDHIIEIVHGKCEDVTLPVKVAATPIPRRGKPTAATAAQREQTSHCGARDPDYENL